VDQDQDMDEDSQEAVDGEHDDVEDVSGSDASQAEEEDEAEEEAEDYDSEEGQEEDGPDENGGAVEDEDDDDVAVISDTTEDDDEEELDEEEHDRDNHESYKVCEQIYDSDEESELSEVQEECDEDDLMDDVVISRRPDKDKVKLPRSQHSRVKELEAKFKRGKVVKRKRQYDWRVKLKKKSVTRLNKSEMRNDSEAHRDVNALSYMISNVASEPKSSKSSIDSSPPFIISQIESVSDEIISTNNSKSEAHLNEGKLEASNMQQINKIQDCIKRSSEEECHEVIKQDATRQNQQDILQQPPVSDENNKENIGNNEKKELNLSKVNGAPIADATPSHALRPAVSKDVVNVYESDEMEVMEISDELSGELSSIRENATVIETKAKDSIGDRIMENNACDIKLEVDDQEDKEDDNGRAIREKDTEIDGNNTQIDNKETLCPSSTPKEDQQLKQSDDLPKTNSPKLDADTNVIETPTKVERPKSPPAPATYTPTPQSEQIGKRSRSPPPETNQSSSEDIHPAKKLKTQIDSNFITHDQILNEYIERTSNNSLDDIQKHLGQLIVEIQTLNDMIKTKEMEWNNLLHLKKVKEEICLRLTRKKQVMEIMSTKIGQVSSGGGDTNLLASYMENLNNFTSDIGNSKLLSSAISAATGTLAVTTIAPVASTPLSVSKSLSAAATSSTPNNVTLATFSNHANVTANILNNLSNISAISVSGVQTQQQSLNAPCGNSIVQNILQNRANMKSSDLVKEKATTQRLHRILVSRNILPKPSTITAATATATNGDSSSNSIGLSLLKSSATVTATPLNATNNISHSSFSLGGSNLPINLTNSTNTGQKVTESEQQPILNNYLTATATIQRQLGEMLNGHHHFRTTQEQTGGINGAQPIGIGRQGVFKDVKSIIADYRQKHPEAVPRRGRRVKTSAGNQGDASTILGNVLKTESRGSTDLGALLARVDGNSRPSSNDSSHSLTNPLTANVAGGNVSFKDVLIQFAKLNEQSANGRSTNLKTPNASGHSNPSNPSFPEVTLHPVTTVHSSIEQGGSSLLHGILTKSNRQNATPPSALVPSSTTSTTNYNSSFSPTLARLLTAPERITSATHPLLPTYHQQTSTGGGINANTLNISKMVSGHNSEITITPVVSSQQVPTLLQQQLEQQQQQISLKRERIKLENLLNAKDDEADDSIDRLVIDEGGDSSVGAEDNLRIAPNAYGLEFNENEVPACQGCKKNEAQFVCAGCANQLYCSRECQVAAWDEHSEVCTG
ncbi:unnamed protein product, partial [Hermetia illucens]